MTRRDAIHATVLADALQAGYTPTEAAKVARWMRDGELWPTLALTLPACEPQAAMAIVEGGVKRPEVLPDKMALPKDVK